jgi:hypothetical protein
VRAVTDTGESSQPDAPETRRGRRKEGSLSRSGRSREIWTISQTAAANDGVHASRRPAHCRLRRVPLADGLRQKRKRGDVLSLVGARATVRPGRPPPDRPSLLARGAQSQRSLASSRPPRHQLCATATMEGGSHGTAAALHGAVAPRRTGTSAMEKQLGGLQRHPALAGRASRRQDSRTADELVGLSDDVDLARDHVRGGPTRR